MTANQVQAQLLEEIDALWLAQRLLLLDRIPSFRSTLKPAAPAMPVNLVERLCDVAMECIDEVTRKTASVGT